jgi:hypothetical protein
VNSSTSAIDRLNGRIAVVFASVAVLLIVLAGWFVLVAPKRAHAAELETKIATAQGELIATQHFLRSSAGQTSAKQLAKLTRAVPATPRTSEILRQLSQAASAAGVRINGITPTAMVSTTGGQALPMTVVVEGHYFRLQKFVRLLRAAATVGTDSVHVSGRLLAIDGIQFATGATSGTTGTAPKGLITATLAVDAFVSTGGHPAQASTTGATATTSP